MPTIDLNVSPYYDDFNPSKDFLRVLFRPGFPVQARELTTLQTILQEQVKHFGDHTFKDGSKVLEAPVSLNTEVYSMNLVADSLINFPTNNAALGSLGTLDNLAGMILTYTATNGKVIKIRTVPSPTGVTGTSRVGRLYFTYLSKERFDDTDINISEGYITALAAENNTTINYFNVFNSVTPASLFTIGEGVYYIDGFFTRVANQTIVLSNTSQTPTANVGFILNSSAITANEDASLYDNARGSSNEGAPGADRLKNTLQLTFRTGNISDPNFYRLVTIVNGVIQEDRAGNPIFNELEKVLARRTYDESGDYTINPIHATVEEHQTDTTKFNVSLAAAKSYVKGFEIDIISDTKVEFDRGLQTRTIENAKAGITGVSYIPVTGVSGLLPGFNFEDSVNGPHTFRNGVLALTNGTDTIGFARPYGYLNGNLYLYDIKMFQAVTASNAITGTRGNDVRVGEARGYLVNNVTNDSNLIIVGSNRTFGTAALVSDTISVPAGTTLTSVTPYTFADVTNIISYREPGIVYTDTPFAATVTSGAVLQNSNSSLLRRLEPTLMSTGTQNDFQILKHSNDSVSGSTLLGNWTNTQMGGWSNYRVDDGASIEKQLRFRALRINTSAVINNNNLNYGWAADHKEITLLEPDIFRVYGIYQSTGETNATTPIFNKINVSVSTGGNVNIYIGSTIRGMTSGAEAIVAINSNTSRVETSLTNNANTHLEVIGSGVQNQIQIISTNGIQFTAGEQLTVTIPDFHPTDQTMTLNDFTDTLFFNSYDTTNVSKDITANFLIDDGQRSEYYDVGRLVRKPSAPIPTSGDLIVFYSYWEDNTDTDDNPYYDVNSYTNASFFGKDVRYFNEPQNILTLNPLNGFNLRNTLDFRLRTQRVFDFSVNPFTFTTREYKKHAHIAPDTTFTFDYTEYLPRRATISLTSKGNYIKTLGVPNVPPRLPDNLPENAMSTHYVTIPAATRYPIQEVEVERIDNRRYTMRDIGAIEKRLDNFEDAVALSLLESQALNDDVGTGRLKTGFIVDDFKDINTPVADREHIEFKSAYVRDRQALSPATYTPRVAACNVSHSNIATDFWNTGFIVKAYTEELLLTQPQASSEHRINPYATWVFNGDISLTPARWVWPQVLVDERGSIVNRDLDADFDPSRHRRVNRGTPVVTRTWTETTDNTRVQSTRRGRTTTTFRAGTRTTTTLVNTRRVDDIRTIDRTQLLDDTLPNGMMYTVRPPQAGLRIQATGMRPNTSLKVEIDGQDLTNRASGGTVRSDGNGVVDTIISIPANTFTPGDLRVVLTDLDGARQTNATSTWIARGEAHFERRDDGIVRRSGVITGRSVDNINETLSVFTEPEPEDNNDNNDDPIAQTFQIPSNGGRIRKACVTSIGIYFATVDPRGDETVGIGDISLSTNNVRLVKVEVREVVNGYPGPRILGSSKYELISKSAGSTDASIETKFNIRSADGGPTFLDSGKEYCMVLKTPSEVTSVWTAFQGELDLAASSSTRGSAITAQPNVGGHFGSFFKSQNNSTWEADQNRDLKFNLYRAKFSTDDSTVTLANVLDDAYEQVGADIPNAITTYANSSYIKINHPNHGMYGEGHRVKLFGIAANLNNGTLNGFPLARLNENIDNTITRNGAVVGGHLVLYPTKDSYFIQIQPLDNDFVLTNISGESTGDQKNFLATYNVQYDALRTKTGYESIDDAVDLRFEIRGATGTNVDLYAEGGALKNASGSNSTNGSRNTLDDGYQDVTIDDFEIFNTPKIILNEVNKGGVGTSFQGRFTLTTTDDFVSPFFERQGNDMDSETIVTDMSEVPIELYSNVVLNTLDFNEIDTQLPETTETDTIQFVSREAALEAAYERATYVTSQVDLEIPANGFRVNFDADMQPESLIEVYYKAREGGDTTPFEEIDWVKFPENQQVNETNFGVFSDDLDFTQYTLETTTGNSFTSFRVKLVMSAKNEAQVPNVRDLRIIASA